MKTLTVSQRMPIAEYERVANYRRLETRGDCSACATCQEWRDSGRARPKEPLACGHKGDEAIWHSRPCPFVGCRHHLLIDVTGRGSLKLNFPDRDWDEIPQTCSIDVAEEGEHTLEQIGDFMNVTRERARQLEARGIATSKRSPHLDLKSKEEKAAALQYLELFGDEHEPGSMVDATSVAERRHLPVLDDEEDERGVVRPDGSVVGVVSVKKGYFGD
jgi:hypothetical protein